MTGRTLASLDGRPTHRSTGPGAGAMQWIPRLALAVAVALIAVACSSTEIVANAGPDTVVSVGTAPSFDGCDSDGEIVDHRWVIIGAPASKEQDIGKPIRNSIAACSFQLESDMELDEIGPWVIELTVQDAAGNTSSDTVTITVSA